MPEYFDNLKKKKKNDELCEINKHLSDYNKVFQLLGSLGFKYDSFTTAMLKPPISSYKELLGRYEAMNFAIRKILRQTCPKMQLLWGKYFTDEIKNIAIPTHEITGIMVSTMQ